MENRREFIKICMTGCALSCVALAVPGLTACAVASQSQNLITKRNPRRALVVWYSQTGHTRRIGRIIHHVWQKEGLTVDGADYREIDQSKLGQYDLVAIGAPVYYMDVPVNLQQWIKTLPQLSGASVAAFVTFGGKGNAQHNTACGLLQRMNEMGGAAAGLGLFGNMSTFAPTWSAGSAARILAFKDRPNEQTYQQARQFARDILVGVAAGKTHIIEREIGLESLAGVFPQIGLTKLMITNHHIDQSLCIKCGACVKTCPARAVNLPAQTVDSSRCIACIGCVNNCPTQAMKMNFLGKPVYGFQEFLRRNKIKIVEPAELNV